MIGKYTKFKIFYVWEIVCIYLLWKFWYLYLLFISYMLISSILIFLKKDSTIVFSNTKLNTFINYFKLNLLISVNQTSINTKTFLNLIGFYLFRIIVGISYKTIRMSISMFDCLYREYIWSDIKKKKKKI